ncbi:hypothetical protein K438DRAFT_1773361 [Mycena galopus ATCC 62051]|nr:hypothetical protein K438DRAFT_1773361 [Mycena galopus ATCC 62051]
MKFLASFALTAAFATTAFAQTITIQAPADGSTVQAGSSIVVEVIQHNFIENLEEVAIAIGLGAPNLAPAIGGDILYNGPFNPQQQNGQFLQNFTVTIPATASTGPMSLNVAHFTLRGIRRNGVEVIVEPEFYGVDERKRVSKEVEQRLQPAKEERAKRAQERAEKCNAQYLRQTAPLFINEALATVHQKETNKDLFETKDIGTCFNRNKASEWSQVLRLGSEQLNQYMKRIQIFIRT